LASRLSRLTFSMHRPERFAEERSELVARLRQLARDGGNP
jgi:hypothetical protein